MDIPRNPSGESHLHAETAYGAALDDLSQTPSSMPRSFTEHVGDFVGSYSRTSLAHMASTVPIASSPGTLHSKQSFVDEEAPLFVGDDTGRVFRDRADSIGIIDETTSLLSAHNNESLNRITTASTVTSYPDTKQHQSSFIQAVFNSVNILTGIGILAMPLGLRIAGWVIGIAVFFFCFVVTNYTAKLLAICLDKDKNAQTYGDIGALAFGVRGRIWISCIFVVELVAVSVALVIFLSDEIEALFGDLDPLFVRAIAFLVLTPMLFVSVRQLSYASILGIMIALTILFVMVTDGLSKPHAPGSLLEPAETEMWPSNWKTVPMSFGLIMAGFAGHSVFPTIYRSMERPEKYGTVVNWTYVATALFYLAVSVCGYLMFGLDVMQEITQNLISVPEYNRTLNLIMIWFLALNPVAKYGLTLHPVKLTWHRVLFRDLHLDRWCGPSVWRHRVVSMLATVGLSAAIVVTAYLVPDFDKVMGLLGAFFAFMISVIFPVACYLRLYGDSVTHWQWTIHVGLLVLSAVIAISGTFASFAPRDS